MVYLDNSATTRVSPSAAQKALEMMTDCFGNPSSLHSLGFKAELEVKNAKKIISSALGCREGELYFTSGGTEANNTAVLGVAKANAKRGKKIVISAIEHSSVLDAAGELSQNGFDVVLVSPDKNGEISPQKIADAVDENTILCSLMLVNNETGAVMDVATAAAAARRKSSKVVVHCDAVQAFSKIPVNVGRLGVDLLSVSAHKIGAPKGCGALYVKKGTKISPMLFGGEQQNRFRPGTENVPAICAFGVAASEATEQMAENFKKAKELKAALVNGLSNFSGLSINSPENALPYLLNFSTNIIKSETLIHFLEKKEIFVSGGSACAKGNRSHVLKAMGLSDLAIDTAIRVSFSSENNLDDINALLSALKEAEGSLQRIK